MARQKNSTQVSVSTMKMRPDQERVRNLLLDTVTLLCKNGLDFKREMKVQGLIGITLDDQDVFLVHFDELNEIPHASQDEEAETPEKSSTKRRSSEAIDLDVSEGPQTKHQKKHHSHHSPKRLDLSSTLRQQHPGTRLKIKEEITDDVVILDSQDHKPSLNMEGGEIDMDSSQFAALTGFQDGGSLGHGHTPGQGWSPGQAGAVSNMVGTLMQLYSLKSLTHVSTVFTVSQSSAMLHYSKSVSL